MAESNAMLAAAYNYRDAKRTYNEIFDERQKLWRMFDPESSVRFIKLTEDLRDAEYNLRLAEARMHKAAMELK